MICTVMYLFWNCHKLSDFKRAKNKIGRQRR